MTYPGVLLASSSSIIRDPPSKSPKIAMAVTPIVRIGSLLNAVKTIKEQFQKDIKPVRTNFAPYFIYRLHLGIEAQQKKQRRKRTYSAGQRLY